MKKMSSQCERCGSPAPAIETATHAFCESCAAGASTGARNSSELLFSLRPPALPHASDDSSLASLARDLPDDARVSVLPLIGPLTMPVPTITPPAWSAKRAFLTAIPFAMFVASAAMFVGSAMFALDAREREARMVAFAEGAVLAQEIVPVIPAEVAIDAPAVQPVVAPPVIAPPTVVDPPAPIEPIVRRARPTPQRPAPEPVVAVEPAPVEERPVLPSRVAVRNALRSLEAEIALCSDGTHGTANTRITFLGQSGRASHAEVTQGGSPEVRSCIARTARNAELPPFSQERFTVAYPFRY
jgi:hypothetical protein